MSYKFSGHDLRMKSGVGMQQMADKKDTTEINTLEVESQGLYNSEGWHLELLSPRARERYEAWRAK